MLDRTDLYPYQQYAKDYILSKNGSMLWLDIGLGKTIIALTAIETLLDQYKAKAALVVAPVKVVEAVWMQEAAKWCHTKRLSFSMVRGTPKERRAALLKPAEIYLINYEGIQWLEKVLESLFYKNLPFDIVVFDEISKMKHTTSKRSRAFYSLLPHMTYRIGLTGTPASNGIIDLHGQYMVIDGGARLGPNITSYRERYFTYNQYSRKYKPRRGSTSKIISKISDITIEMASEDYLQLPPLVDVDRKLKLSEPIMKQYREFAKDFFTEIDGTDLEVFSASAKTAKERQLANGAVYTNQVGEERAWTVFHNEKLDMLEELVDELNGKPLLVCYQFIHDKIRIKERFPDAVFIDNNNVAPIVEDWTAGKTRILVGHPQCLHPSTKVLTEHRGWVKIVDTEKSDRVFDGVEFVSHSGCSCSGVKEVIDTFGIKMTPNHKLLINQRWVEAEDVGDSRNTKREALYQYQGDDEYLIEMLTMRENLEDTKTECSKTQQKAEQVLSTLYKRFFPLYDRNKILEDMARYGASSYRHSGQELWGERYWDLQRVDEFYEFSKRYAPNIPRQSDDREIRQLRRIFEEKLYLGDKQEAASQQKNKPETGIQRSDYALGRVMSKSQYESWQTDCLFKSRRNSGRGGKESRSIDLSGGAEESKVYDLVDCGPRHQFLIKNNEGEAFVSHNSMGHGLNLQFGGNHICWFGLTYNLEHYIQAIGRLLRNGQKHHTVFNHRLLAEGTIEDWLAKVISSKDITQDGIRRAVKNYKEVQML